MRVVLSSGGLFIGSGGGAVQLAAPVCIHGDGGELAGAWGVREGSVAEHRVAMASTVSYGVLGWLREVAVVDGGQRALRVHAGHGAGTPTPTRSGAWV